MAVQTTYNIEVLNLDALMQKLSVMQASNPSMNKQLNTIMREVIKHAVNELKRDAKNELPNDPRKAFNAVRSSVYKKILGGQVNIISRKKNNGKMYVGEKKRTLRPGQRGGNRMKVSERTKQMEGYYGTDRGFILRFLNSGTYKGDREAGTKYHAMRPAKRGQIAARNWFMPSATRSLQHSANEFSELFDRAIIELWNEN